MPSETSASDVVWNSDTLHALGLCRVLEQFLGIWPLNCHDLYSKIRLFIVAILEVTMAINLTREILADCVVIDQMVNFISLIACSFISLLKVTILRINREKMKLVIKSAIDDWTNTVGTKNRKIMKNHAKIGRLVFIFQMVSALITALLLILAPLPFFIPPLTITKNSTIEKFNDHTNSSTSSFIEINETIRQRYLPMGTGCFVNDASTIVYVLIYVLQIVQLLTTCVANVGTDVYFFSITMHVCGQFELLKIDFENFGENPNVSKCHEEIGKLVERHNHLIKLSNNFEKTFNIVILAQLSSNAIHMSLLGIQIIISIKIGNGIAVIGALVGIYVLSLQLFLYSYAGDYLTMQIEKIRYATYSCRWYNLSPSVVKDLTFVMSRSNIEFNLTAGKVFHMNVDNFKNILKAMGSYFSMLKIMLNE